MAASKPKHDLRSVASRFQIYGDFGEAAPYGSGHINDTYAAVFDQAGTAMRYIFQRVNHNVFKDPAGLMGNVERVTAHIRRKLEAAGADQVSRRVLTLVPAHDEQMLARRCRGQSLALLPFHRAREKLRPDRNRPPGLRGGPRVWPVPEAACRPARAPAARHDPQLPPHPQPL